MVVLGGVDCGRRKVIVWTCYPVTILLDAFCCQEVRGVFRRCHLLCGNVLTAHTSQQASSIVVIGMLDILTIVRPELCRCPMVLVVVRHSTAWPSNSGWKLSYNLHTHSCRSHGVADRHERTVLNEAGRSSHHRVERTRKLQSHSLSSSSSCGREL